MSFILVHALWDGKRVMKSKEDTALTPETHTPFNH
jgi:hypothetical protein